MVTFLTILYVVVCVFLILVVLLQAGRGGGMGAAFGGSSQTVFGGAGAGNFLTRLTVIMAAAFMLLSATLAYLSSGSDKALEDAAKALKLREEARKLSPKDKAAGAAGAAASQSGLTSTTPDGGAAEALGTSPVEGLDQPGSALEAVDDALKAPAEAPPAKPTPTKPKKAAEPTPVAPAKPAEPTPAPQPAPAPDAPAQP
jgi:preprotein translocase subunit SecG